jgi:hypothetical protein
MAWKYDFNFLRRTTDDDRNVEDDTYFNWR